MFGEGPAIDWCPDCRPTATPRVYYTCSTCSVTGTCAGCRGTYVYVRDRRNSKSYCPPCAEMKSLKLRKKEKVV